jgi:hypothetical protein
MRKGHALRTQPVMLGAFMLQWSDHHGDRRAVGLGLPPALLACVSSGFQPYGKLDDTVLRKLRSDDVAGSGPR